MTNDARNMRNDLMGFLLDEANNLASDLMVWEDLAMRHASDIQKEL
jgi:hypothetical protein